MDSIIAKLFFTSAILASGISVVVMILLSDLVNSYPHFKIVAKFSVIAFLCSVCAFFVLAIVLVWKI